MRFGTPFRAAAMFAAALASLSHQFGAGSTAFRLAAAKLPAYEGRGKHRARHHDNGGTRRAQRAAVKRRNIKRFRAQARG